jgi:hypothetical protein
MGEVSSGRSEPLVEVKYTGFEAVEIYRQQIAQATQLKSQGEAIEVLTERVQATANAVREVAENLRAVGGSHESILSAQKSAVEAQEAVFARIEATLSGMQATLARVERQLQEVVERQARAAADTDAGDLERAARVGGTATGPEARPGAPNGYAPFGGRGFSVILLTALVGAAGFALSLKAGWASLLPR